MMTIVTKFGELRVNWIPVRMCTTEDIIKAKLDELLSNIEGVKIYIDNILVLSKDIFPKHID